MTGKTIKRFSFIIIIVWLGIIITRVVTIGTVITGTTVTGSIVLLVVTDFFDKCTRGVTSRG